ncbi:carboxymuconolactone decarboxylase family protein [Bacillus sp. SG-1]|uniref:carboxymuconolactone decarboxylase family protein n=1 Tax=Bacillus sp. SG-1 TaxID=161544 RepID=UPI000154454A|nr:carboxymuconolactone decarboxylase family protein [Bacillus sp. SG-1]EDL64329.1 hypothetical protein BSG1_14463 [Bacillus sp. SG-1]
MNERLSKGLEAVEEYAGSEALTVLEGIKQFSPSFYHMMLEFGFGDVYTRPNLDFQQRNLIVLSSLITQGASEQLPVHFHAAIKAGLTPDQILEVILHSIPYAGFPKSLSALMTAKKFFEDHQLSTKDY